MKIGRVAIGRRIERLRKTKGMSRQQVAAALRVDLTAVAAWEGGKYLPRARRRVMLAELLGVDVGTLFAEEQTPAPAESAALVDTLNELPGLLRDLVGSAERTLKAFRLAAPYPTPPHVQEEFRRRLDARIRDGSIAVDRLEIFYDLRRFQEVVSNILRYQGLDYRVRIACDGAHEVVPALGGYMFDDREFLMGGYWVSVPPEGRPGLRLCGEPFRTFFADYWSEIWSRATPLNPDGKPDEAALKRAARQLGLGADDWERFVEEAKGLTLEDGLPPLA